MDRRNSNRFLDAFAEIERLLRRVGGDDRHLSFYRLVDAAASQDSAIRSFAIDLKEYADLRNAIVHERTNGEVIAEPHFETVTRLEDIRDVLSNPPRVEAHFLTKVVLCSPGDRIGTAARLMLDGAFSQAPVYQDKKFMGLLTSETIARWLAAQLESGIGLLEEQSVAQVLDHTEDPENHTFVSRKATLFKVLELFREFERKGKSLDAVIVTEAGRRDQTAIGILTVFDLPGVYDTVGLGRGTW